MSVLEQICKAGGPEKGLWFCRARLAPPGPRSQAQHQEGPFWQKAMATQRYSSPPAPLKGSSLAASPQGWGRALTQSLACSQPLSLPWNCSSSVLEPNRLHAVSPTETQLYTLRSYEPALHFPQRHPMHHATPPAGVTKGRIEKVK